MISHISFSITKLEVINEQTIAVARAGYVGLSIVTPLAQHNHVVLADVVPKKLK